MIVTETRRRKREKLEMDLLMLREQVDQKMERMISKEIDRKLKEEKKLKKKKKRKSKGTSIHTYKSLNST